MITRILQAAGRAALWAGAIFGRTWSPLLHRPHYEGHHSESFLDMHWSDQIIPIQPVAGRPPWEIHHARPGENQLQRNWAPSYAEVLAPHVIRGLAHATADETVTDLLPVIRGQLGGTTVRAVVDYLFDGLLPEQRWTAA